MFALIKQPTCFKNLEKPSCIDLILTNRPRSFQGTCVIKRRLTDFHKMTISVLKIDFWRLLPKFITFRDFKKFDNERFINSLQSVLFDPHTGYNIHDPDVFFQICQKVRDNHAPWKEKYIRGNHKLFMSKTLLKAIMQQTHFRSKFRKNPLDKKRGIFIQNKVIYVCQF